MNELNRKKERGMIREECKGGEGKIGGGVDENRVGEVEEDIVSEI